jgi:acetyltransferase-like isoleucine patch superfamily enzyme
MKLARILSILKSVHFNFRHLDFPQALKLPVYVHYQTEVHINKGSRIEIPGNAPRFSIKLGSPESTDIQSWSRNYIFIDGIVTFKGFAVFGKGFSIYVANQSSLIIGENFCANCNLHLSSVMGIRFGKDVLIGWNCTFRDGDGHKINNVLGKKPIVVGDSVWIGAFCDIVKGAAIKDHCVIATHSLVTERSCIESRPNSILGGIPAKVIKENISWER